MRDVVTRTLIRVVATATIVSAFVLAPYYARPVAACSAGPDFNPVVDSSVIVAGRVVGRELGTPIPVLPPPAGLVNVPLRVTMTVDQVFKGASARTVTFVDFGGTYAADLAAARYPDVSAGRGQCSVFDTDPFGAYVILGLIRDNGGGLLANRLFVFYRGEEPNGPAWDGALARLAALGGFAHSPVLPRTGASESRADGPVPLRLAVGVMAVTFLLVMSLRVRSIRRT